MMDRLKQLWRIRPRLTAAFLFACAVTLFFTATFAYRTVYWATHQDMPIGPWMTMGYVARSWDLDGRDIYAQAGFAVPQEKGHPQTLQEIANDLGVPVQDIIDKVEEAVAILRAESE